MMQFESKQKEKGITLVALVITVIVLLILAAVSMSLISGNGDLFGKANTAADTMKTAEKNEQNEYNNLMSFMNTYYGQNGGNSGGGNGSGGNSSGGGSQEGGTQSGGSQTGDTTTKYTVTYNTHGANEIVAAETDKASGAIVILPTVTKTSFTFKGWYTAETEGTKVGDAGEEYTVTGNVTLHAQWEAANMVLATASVANNTTHTPTTLEYSWETIGKLAKAISTNWETKEGAEQITKTTEEVNVVYNGDTYTLGIGDEKEIVTDNVSRTVRIIGFNHDKLASTGAYGGTNHYAGITFEYVDPLETNITMNNEVAMSSGGYGETYMATNVLPGAVVNVEGSIGAGLIKTVKKKYLNVYNSTNTNDIQTLDCKFFLLSADEIWNDFYTNDRVGIGKTNMREGTLYESGDSEYRYKLYAKINAQYNKENSALLHYNEGETSSVWLRSLCPTPWWYNEEIGFEYTPIGFIYLWKSAWAESTYITTWSNGNKDAFYSVDMFESGSYMSPGNGLFPAFCV